MENASTNQVVHTSQTPKVGTWTADELELIRQNYATSTIKELAETLNRPYSAVNSKIFVMQAAGMLKPKLKPQKAVHMKKEPDTTRASRAPLHDNELQYILDNYKNMTGQAMAEHLRRSASVVHKYIRLAYEGKLVVGANKDAIDTIPVSTRKRPYKTRQTVKHVNPEKGLRKTIGDYLVMRRKPNGKWITLKGFESLDALNRFLRLEHDLLNRPDIMVVKRIEVKRVVSFAVIE